MESQQFSGEDGRNYMSSSSDEALPDTIVSGKIQHGHFDISPRPRRRAILKDGYSNTFNSNVPLAGLTSVTQDFFTFMMECRWRTLLLLFFTSFLFSWLVFAALYWAVAFGHGDLRGYDELHDPTKEPCVTMMDDFISCFLFSMETQYSSGYGTRSPTTECPEAVFLVGFQSIFGALLQLSMSGIIFAKFARPKMRQQAIMFSEKAVISVRDRHLCLMFRLGDCRKSRLLGATVSARLLQHRVSAEGEKLPLYQHTLKLSVDSSGSNIFLLWPLTAVHRIDSSSPLYDISAADLAASTFEVFVALAGTVETMGQDTEARTSYTAQEILWGHRLTPLVKTCGRGYILDYSRFHSTVPVDTPRCSARQLYCWTHNYVRLNKDPGILGNPHGFLDHNKRFLRERDDFLGNNDEFFGNKDEFLEKKRLLDSKDGVSGNGEGFSDNKQGYLVDKGGFLCNGDEFLEERDQVLGEKNGYIISDQGNELSKKKDGILCPIFWGNEGKSLTNNRSPNNQGGILDIEDEISGSNHPLLGDEESHSANNNLFADKHGKVLTKKVSGATTNGSSTGRDEFLNRKYDYSGTKDIFSDKNELILNRREGLLDKKFEFLGNKDRILGKSDDEVVGKNQPADYREENELEQNSEKHLSGPVRRISTILKDGHESNLHHSLISLLDKKQRNRLTTLSEDDLR